MDDIFDKIEEYIKLKPVEFNPLFSTIYNDNFNQYDELVFKYSFHVDFLKGKFLEQDFNSFIRYDKVWNILYNDIKNKKYDYFDYLHIVCMFESIVNKVVKYSEYIDSVFPQSEQPIDKTIEELSNPSIWDNFDDNELKISLGIEDIMSYFIINIMNNLDSDFLAEYIDLYYFIKNYAELGLENIYPNIVQNFEYDILNLLIRFKMGNLLFEFISINGIHIDSYGLNIYNILPLVENSEHAQMLYSYTENSKIRWKNLNKKLDTYYLKIKNIVFNYNELKKLERIFKYPEISNFSFTEKVQLFNNIEKELFLKFRIGKDFKLKISNIFAKFFQESTIAEDINDAIEELFEDNNKRIIENNALYFELVKIYSEMASLFSKINNIFDFSKNETLDFKKDIFDSNFFDSALKDTLELVNICDLKEISEFANKSVLTAEYDEAKVVDSLRITYENLNIRNSEELINNILKYTKVKKTLLSATYFWGLYETTQNMAIDKDGQEYTPIVANYFKAVEILLARKIRDFYLDRSRKGIQVKKIYNVKSEVVDMESSNWGENFTLGEMCKYIKREQSIIKDGCSQTEFIELLEYWIKEIRNSHFHRDLILSKNKASEIRNQTLKMISEIITYLV